MKGKFYGIGVGPGDPELLTLKAHRVLKEADMVCVPKSAADRESLALSIISQTLNRRFTTLELSFPMSRDRQVLEEHWARAGETVARQVREGKVLAFVTIGDPLFYSTYGYVLRYLQEHHPDLPAETIPGVTAMNACAALLQEPLAEGEESLVVIPAAYGLDRLRDALDHFDNVVLMKVNRCWNQVLELLRERGLSTGATLVSRCGYPDQAVERQVDRLAGQELDYMSILIIRQGKVKGETP